MYSDHFTLSHPFIIRFIQISYYVQRVSGLQLNYKQIAGGLILLEEGVSPISIFLLYEKITMWILYYFLIYPPPPSFIEIYVHDATEYVTFCYNIMNIIVIKTLERQTVARVHLHKYKSHSDAYARPSLNGLHSV